MRYIRPIKLLLLTLILITYKKAISQEINPEKSSWILIGNSKEGEKYLINSEIVKKDEEGIKIWIKVENYTLTFNKIKYKNAELKQLVIINCEEKQIKHIRMVIYSSSGKVIRDAALEDYEQKWRDVIPESSGEIFINSVCDKFN